jgi:pentatricopeptide repeat protein
MQTDRTNLHKLITCCTQIAVGGMAYSAAINACERAGQWEKAVNLLNKMPSAGVPRSAYAYNFAISACAKAGHTDKALELLADMEKEVGGRTVFAELSLRNRLCVTAFAELSLRNALCRTFTHTALFCYVLSSVPL